VQARRLAPELRFLSLAEFDRGTLEVSVFLYLSPMQNILLFSQLVLKLVVSVFLCVCVRVWA
jgi:hypothetical protein